MIKHYNLNVVRNLITECKCDRCKKDFIPENLPTTDFSQDAIDKSEYLSGYLIETTAGYASHSDMQRVSLAFCDNCLVELQKQFQSES